MRARSLPIRHVRPNRSSANPAEKIRDVGDNVPPRNGCWSLSKQDTLYVTGRRTNALTIHREGRCPQCPIYFLRGARTKNMRAYFLLPCATSAPTCFNANPAEKIRDVGDNVPPGKMRA
jgi:hypothetical protein